MPKSSARFVAPLLALVITAGALSAVAQTKSKSSKSRSTAASRKESSKYHRLPTYFGKLELKEEQIEEIYSIKATMGPEIEVLAQELAELKKEQADKIHDVLTRTQVTALNKLKDGTATTKKSSSKSGTSKSGSSRKSSSRKSSSKDKDKDEDEDE